MNFSYRQLRGFLAVAEHGSFTKAAEQLHVTQAGLSAMVREFEDSVGCRLFERSTRAVTLTAQGQALLPVALRTVAELGHALSRLTQSGERARNTLRVGVTPLIASSVMPEILRVFAQEAPDVVVDMQDLDRGVIQQGVEEGSLDAGFGAFFGKVVGVKRRAIFPAHLALAQPYGAIGEARRKRAVPWTHVEVARLIALPADNAIQRLVDRHAQSRPENVARRRTVTHLETVLALVEAGLGEAIVPSFAGVAGQRWRVTLAPLVPRVDLDYYVITRAGRRDVETIDRFAETFTRVMRTRLNV